MGYVLPLLGGLKHYHLYLGMRYPLFCLASGTVPCHLEFGAPPLYYLPPRVWRPSFPRLGPTAFRQSGEDHPQRGP